MTMNGTKTITTATTRRTLSQIAGRTTLISVRTKKGNVYVYEFTLAGYRNGEFGSFGYPDVLVSERRFGLKHVRQGLRRKLERGAATLEPGTDIDISRLARGREYLGSNRTIWHAPYHPVLLLKIIESNTSGIPF